MKRNCCVLAAILLVALALLSPVARGADAAAGATSAEAITALEHLAAKATLVESHLDLTLMAGQVLEPNLDVTAVKRKIATMAEEVRKAIAEEDDPKARIAALNKVIFQIYDYAVPDAQAPIISGEGLHTYVFHRFVMTRRAYCEGLATLYLIVGQEAGLPVAICNAPIHTYCRLETKQSHLNIECTEGGSLQSDEYIHTVNGAKPAAVGSNTYFCPLSKKQFLNLQINSIAYGLAKQETGPLPLTIKEMVRLAELIEKLDPDRPESLDTAALIHFQAGNPRRAADLEARAIGKAKRFGTTDRIMAYFQDMLKQYLKEKD